MPSIWQRFRSFLATIRLAGGTKMKVIQPGADNDGLDRPLGHAGTDIDKPYQERYDDIQDALDAWRKHPLARRIVNLITAYVIGDGIRISSKYGPLQRFIDDFWQHGRNRIILRQADWCDELTRSGELFLVLFTNPIDGMSHVRSVPASRIDEVEWKKHDYEVELRYHEVGDGLSVNDQEREGTWWQSFDHPDAADPTVPIMLHFAVNRPVGRHPGRRRPDAHPALAETLQPLAGGPRPAQCRHAQLPLDCLCARSGSWTTCAPATASRPNRAASSWLRMAPNAGKRSPPTCTRPTRRQMAVPSAG